MSSTIYRDPLKRYGASSLYADIETIHMMFNDIKASIDANASDWFPTTVVSTYEDSNNNTLYTLTLYDEDNDPIITFQQGYHTTSSSSYNTNGYYIAIVAHASVLDVSDQNPSWFNKYVKYPSRRWFVTKITYNEKFISFSFASDEGNDELFLQGSSLFLVKTNHNNIAVLRSNVGNPLFTEGSSNSYWGGPINSSYYLGSSPSTKNARLSCITKESATSYWDETTRYGQATIQESTLVMRPVMVSGVSDDYCIDTFYAASSPFLLADVTDGVMTIGKDEYFTNGIVYVKL